MEVKSPYGPIERGTDNDFPVWSKDHGGYGRGVVREGDEAETRGCVPKLHLCIVSPGNQRSTIGAVGHGVHVAEVSLLFENVGF